MEMELRMFGLLMMSAIFETFYEFFLSNFN